MCKLLDRVDSQGVAVLWDVANGYIDYGEPIEETFEKLRKYIRHTHIKDAKKEYPNAKYCIVGKGDLPIGQMIKLLESADYDGWLSLEWEKMWHPELEEPEEVLDVFIDLVKCYMGK
jgi:sugar phosphate isomerase/epimerase